MKKLFKRRRKESSCTLMSSGCAALDWSPVSHPSAVGNCVYVIHLSLVTSWK